MTEGFEEPRVYPLRLPTVPKWQDLVFAIGSFVFILGLVPTVVGDNKPETLTALSTAAVLYTFLPVYISYRLWTSLVMGATTATLWLVIAIQTF